MRVTKRKEKKKKTRQAKVMSLKARTVFGGQPLTSCSCITIRCVWEEKCLHWCVFWSLPVSESNGTLAHSGWMGGGKKKTEKLETKSHFTNNFMLRCSAISALPHSPINHKPINTVLSRTNFPLPTYSPTTTSPRQKQ